MKYEQGPLDEFPEALKEFKAWQKEKGIKVDGIYGNESHNTMWDFIGMIEDALQRADAEIIELTTRLQECCQPDDPGPVYPPNEGMSGWAILFFVILAAALGFLGGQAF